MNMGDSVMVYWVRLPLCFGIPYRYRFVSWLLHYLFQFPATLSRHVTEDEPSTWIHVLIWETENKLLASAHLLSLQPFWECTCGWRFVSIANSALKFHLTFDVKKIEIHAGLCNMHLPRTFWRLLVYYMNSQNMCFTSGSLDPPNWHLGLSTYVTLIPLKVHALHWLDLGHDYSTPWLFYDSPQAGLVLNKYTYLLNTYTGEYTNQKQPSK